MQIRQLFTDDDAVSPVIGVILMVAITVILAAVIASFVLGLGSQPQTTPQTQFEFDYTNSAGDNDGVLTVTHNGGETLEPAEVEIRGDLGPSLPATATIESAEPSPNVPSPVSTPISWADVSPSVSEVSTGNSIIFPAGPGYDITVTYVPSEGGNTAPLGDDQGPDA